MNSPVTETHGKTPEHTDQNFLQRLCCYPWWGYACVSLGGMFAVQGAMDLFSIITGFDMSGLRDLVAGALIMAMLGCVLCALACRFVRTGPAPENRPLLKLAGILLAGGFACTFIGIGIPATVGASNAAAAAHTDIHSFAAQHGRIGVPGNWQKNDELSQQLGALIMSDPSTNLALYASGVMRVDSTAPSFDVFAQTAFENLKAQYQSVNIVETRHSAAGRFTLHETRFHCVIEQTRAEFLVWYVDCGELWVEARVWGPVSSMQEHGQLTTRILESIEPSP